MPGIFTPEQWAAYVAGQLQPSDEATPSVTFVEPMLRRRLSRLSRQLLAVAKPCAEVAPGSRAMVFASQHGELTTTVQLLQALAKQETPSPMGFSLSVHNTAAGLYSIATRDQAPATAIAAGQHTLKAALIEAYGQLHNGADSVVMAYAEEPLTAVYAPFADAETPLCAIGLCLVKEGSTVTLSLDEFDDSASLIRLLQRRLPSGAAHALLA